MVATKRFSPKMLNQVFLIVVVFLLVNFLHEAKALQLSSGGQEDALDYSPAYKPLFQVRGDQQIGRLTWRRL